MVSQGSYCDSDGIPDFMQAALDDEDGLTEFGPRREVEEYPILVSPQYGGLDSVNAYQNDTEARPIIGSDSEEEGEFLGTDKDAIEWATINRVAKAAFAIYRNERSELMALRNKMNEVQNFLLGKGLSMDQCEKEIMEKNRSFNSGFHVFGKCSGIMERDDFGLPIIKEKSSKAVVGDCGDEEGPSNRTRVWHNGQGNIENNFLKKAGHLFDKSPEIENACPSFYKPENDIQGQQEKGCFEQPKLWKHVVQEQHGVTSGEKLEYFPPFLDAGDGIPIIKPPKDFMISSQKAWHTSLVGYFLGGNLPFKLVEEEAKRLWLHLGFVRMYMVKKGFFVFKFNSETDRNKVLAGGPWHFKRNQVFLKQWFEGKKLEKRGLLNSRFG